MGRWGVFQEATTSGIAMNTPFTPGSNGAIRHHSKARISAVTPPALVTHPPTTILPISASERQSGVVLAAIATEISGDSRDSSRSRPPLVNRLHDFLGPPHRIRDCAHGRRNSLPTLKLCQLARSEDTRRDQQYAFAALVHAESLSDWLFVRLKDTGNYPVLPYRPLPFLGVIAGQMGQMSRVRSLANPLVRGSFASVMGKIGSPKNKLPLPAPLHKTHRVGS
jgi:hypothetical protein